MIGVHGVVIAGEDISCLVDTVSINHGRDDTTSQPEASSATINFTATPEEPLPLVIDVGGMVLVTTTTASGASTRFRGKVTDITLSWEDADEDTPDHGVGQIIATGTIADIGRRVVGDEPFPQELDGARVSRIMALAGVPMDPLTNDPGVADILPRDIDSRAALEVAHAAAASAFGVLWTDREGNVRYADAQHRRGIPVGLALDSCDILVTPQWKRTTEGLTNKVSIGYGVAPEDEEGGGGEQPRYVAERPDSIAKWGTFDYSSTTELADAAAAQRMGEIVLARNSEPVWIMSDLPVDVPSLDDARYEALLDLDMHSLISLTGLPSLGHAPTSATLWVEGYTETLAYGTHDMKLTVSGYCRTTPPTRWDDVDPGWMWGGGEKGEARRNYAVNPALNVDAAHWTMWDVWGNFAGAFDRIPGGDGPPIGRDCAYARVTWTSGNPNGRADGGGVRVNQPAGDGIRVEGLAGQTITVSMWARSSNPNRHGRMVIDLYGDSSNIVGGSLYADYKPNHSTLGWVQHSMTLVVPDVATRMVATMQMYDYATDPVPPSPVIPGETWDVSALLVEVAGETLPYFDGDSPDTADEDYQWASGRGGSQSIQMVMQPLHTLAETRRNVALNPALAIDANHWSEYTSAIPYHAGRVVVTDGPLVDHTSPVRQVNTTYRITFDGPGGTNATGFRFNNVNKSEIRVIGGGKVHLSVWVRFLPFYEGRKLKFTVGFKDAAGVNLPAVSGGEAYTVDGWFRVSDLFDVPATAVTCSVELFTVHAQGPGWVATDAIEATGFMVELAAPPTEDTPDYFDGDTPDLPTVDYRWAGVPGDSESVQSAVVLAQPVVPPTLQWDQSACLGPPVDQGRWNDQPSTLRWDQLGSTEWDAYTTEGA